MSIEQNGIKICTVIGARPQFIKAAAVSKYISKFNETSKVKIDEVIIHTGQHFDENMSAIFFEQMNIPAPKYSLDLNSLNHGAMTGRMLEKIEEVLIIEKPDIVLVYGDTNSTIAGALAAKKLHIKVAHVEAGLRSFNMDMPEEINRILTDRISDILFCPTDTAIKNLKSEGYDNIKCDIIKSGDVMQDAAIHFSEIAKKPEFEILEKFILTTIHRAENTNDINKLKNIFKGLEEISKEISIILPLHPRTRNIIKKNNIRVESENIKIIDPVGYLEVLYLLKKCSLVMTDSGGMQKEAFFFKKPCITLREETEWKELVDNGFNTIVGSDTELMKKAYNDMAKKELDFEFDLYGNGKASEKIISSLINI